MRQRILREMLSYAKQSRRLKGMEGLRVFFSLRRGYIDGMLSGFQLMSRLEFWRMSQHLSKRWDMVERAAHRHNKDA